MKNILSSILIIVLLSTNTMVAQLGVGTINPDSTSMLDITSTTKGLLAPRMTSLQKNAIVSPANGLLVYDTDLGRFNYFNGTSWVTIEANTGRDNYVIVKSLADLPPPVANVITLSSGILYEINGSIALGTNSIDLNDCILVGGDPNSDQLIYTGSDALFSGSNGGLVQFLNLLGNTGATKLFNLNDATLTKNFIIRDCFASNFGNIGTIAGFGFTFLRTMSYFNNSNGLIFSGATQVYLYDMIWNGTNSGTGVTFTGNFNIISITGGNLMIDAGEIGVDVTSNPTIVADAIIAGVSFTGAGSRTAGTFSKEWEIEASGIDTKKDDVATGTIYISTPTLTSISTSDTPQKANGTTTSVNLFRFDTNGVDNRLRYMGTKTRIFTIIASLSITSPSNNLNASIYIAKNDAVLNSTRILRKIATGSDIGATGISGTVELSPGDYIEVWLETDGGEDITLEAMNIQVK